VGFAVSVIGLIIMATLFIHELKYYLTTNIVHEMSTRRLGTDVHEFDGMFKGSKVHYKVTSVIGHVLSTDFPPAYQNWETTDPFDLFQAPIIKMETNPKV